MCLLHTLTWMKVYRFSPAAAIKWQPLAKGLYFTSCLTQCLFLTPESVLTAGTDGHTALWSLSSTMEQSHTTLSRPEFSMKWQLPLRIHQSSSKVMASQRVSDHRLVISGGDDGSVALLLFDSTQVTLTPETMYAAAPVLLNRAHASAVTACAIIQHEQRIFILTSGNDQWVRLWEVMVHHKDGTVITTVPAHGQGMLDVSRLGKIKTNVADVSSMAVVEAGEAHARIIICGVGMEVVRVEWNRSA
jgi:WD40 repeat protein